MPMYYVNSKAQSNGDHEVHLHDCPYMPGPPHNVYVGKFDDCHAAVREASKKFSQTNGCIHCCKACHKS